MCGIAGQINFNQTQVAESVLNCMISTMLHRGPDDNGVMKFRNLGLAHTRLAINDLSKNSAQPMTYRGFTLIYNGEIYNTSYLKAKLSYKNVEIKSTGDTEILLKYLVTYGIGNIRNVNGMFAFALFDQETGNLFLSRDRIGIKPLYYAVESNKFIFGSETKILRKVSNKSFELDFKSLQEYMTFQNIISNNTFDKNIQVLEPGNILEININEKHPVIRITKYWTMEFEKIQVVAKEDSQIQELVEKIKDSVLRQSQADVDMGSFLSSGIDSTTISCLAKSINVDLKTFTVGFNEDTEFGNFDETNAAREIAAEINVTHFIEKIDATNWLEYSSQVFCILDEPRVGQSYPNYVASRLAASQVKVVLSGTGGDELFGGYPWRYPNLDQIQTFNNFKDEYFSIWSRLIPKAHSTTIFAPISSSIDLDYPRRIFETFMPDSQSVGIKNFDWINVCLAFEVQTFLRGLLLVEDKLSMHFSLENRLPFLDNEIIDLALKIPIDRKIARNQESGKLILREALQQILPGNVRSKPKKGFSGPDALWMRSTNKSEMLHRFTNPKNIIFNFLDFSTVQLLIMEHMNGKANHRLFLWSLLHLEYFFGSQM